MTEQAKARENELMAFAQKCKDAGLRVFFDEWSHYVARKEYFHVSDGIGIAYVANSDINFGYFTLSITYKGSKTFGSGCNLRDWEEWRDPHVEDVVNACAMRQAPGWLIERENRGREPWKKPLEPEFYKDVDEWLEAHGQHCKVVEL